jgi:hypothetical protein
MQAGHGGPAEKQQDFRQVKLGPDDHLEKKETKYRRQEDFAPDKVERHGLPLKNVADIDRQGRGNRKRISSKVGSIGSDGNDCQTK